MSYWRLSYFLSALGAIKHGRPGQTLIRRAPGPQVYQIMAVSAACLIIFSPNLTKKKKNPTGGDGKRFPIWFSPLWSRGGRRAAVNGQNVTLRDTRAFFYVVGWKGCYWALEGLLWYVRCSAPCERIKLIIHVNTGGCASRGSFDACARLFSRVFFF